jgi:DNA-binding PadR family transcriptional regulator
MTPITEAGAPNVPERNSGTSGYTISLEISVSRLTAVSSRTFREIPWTGDGSQTAFAVDSSAMTPLQVSPILTGQVCFLDLTLRSNFFYSVVEMHEAPSLGEFEQIVLLAILRLADNAYGVTIGAEITACTSREPAPGALYTTLDRLEDKGLVASRLGDPTPQRGGRAKRYFVLNAKGLAAITRAQQSYRRLLEGCELPGLTYA